MIVRTYTRRTRCAGRSCSDVVVLDGDDSPDSSVLEDAPLSQDSLASQDLYGFSSYSSSAAPFASQDSFVGSSLDSDPFDFDESPVVPFLPPPEGAGKAKKPPKGAKGKKPDLGSLRRVSSFSEPLVATPAAASTSTLMEAQEFGEMMEHMDEVNFALDGLRPGSPVRIRRASLLSLLSICATSQQRRLLRAQGTVKQIIDAVLGLNLDDSPSAIAAAALFYVLASDVQDDHMLESPTYVRFLIKLLNPSISDTVKGKTPSIGSRLLVLHSRGTMNGINKRLDSSAASIISKVQEILLNCKEIKPPNGDEEDMERPELSSKWIVLLTMEKACLSTVSLEETSGAIRKVNGNFKERLREFGGLDAIFTVAATCHSNMKGLVENESSSVWELKDVTALESVVLLLKCLKIMENATFLSKENQDHLLGMNTKLIKGSKLSCIELILSATKILSGLSLLRKSSIVSNNLRQSGISTSVPASRSNIEFESKDRCRENSSRIISNDSAECSGAQRPSMFKSFETNPKRQKLSPSKTESSGSASETVLRGAFSSLRKGTASVSQKNSVSGLAGIFSVNTNCSRANSKEGSSKRVSVDVAGPKLNHLDGSNGQFANPSSSKMGIVSLGQRLHAAKDSTNCSVDGGSDPFAFDEDELEPSKWDELEMKNEPSQTHQLTAIDRELEAQLNKSMASCYEVMDDKSHHSDEELDCSGVDDDSNLLEECLLAAVKVLMNLTNDNPVGCQQIGACGGLDAMASLISSHFPFPDSTSSHGDISLLGQHDGTSNLSKKRLNDYELDFLVAILGLLVNLVEKDSKNRSRLVSARVQVDQGRTLESEETHRDVIPLLCSIFLANQGSGEAGDSSLSPPCNDEAVLLQGEREAEMMIIEAYAALLLAFLSTESKNARGTIAGCLPNRNLKILVPVLERFVEFHLSLNMISPETHSAVSEVIESCRIP